MTTYSDGSDLEVQLLAAANRGTLILDVEPARAQSAGPLGDLGLPPGQRDLGALADGLEYVGIGDDLAFTSYLRGIFG